MAFPKLDVPTFELHLPVLNKTVKYRPFLVKENKVLMMLSESDADGIGKIVADLVNSCTFGVLDANKLASVDLEYLFLNIRAKSIGESYDFVASCVSCEEKIQTKANIEKIKVSKDESHTSKIMLSDTVGIQMKYPTFSQVLEVYQDTSSEALLKLIKRCIKATFTPDTYDEVEDPDSPELDEFLGDMTKERFAKLEQFLQTMPALVQEVEADCPNCGAHNNIEIRGLENFFA